MTYRAEVLADAPWAFWPLGDDFLDVSGNGRNNALLAGAAPTAATIVANEPLAHSTTFDGASYISFTNAHAAALTVEMWLQTSTGEAAILGDYNTYQAGITSGSGPACTPYWTATHAPSSGAGHGDSGTLADGLPHHVVWAWSDTVTLVIYVDGVALATVGSVSRGEGGGGSLGGYGAPPWFTGQMQDVAIYDHALSAARVAAHYAAGISGGATSWAGSAHGASASSGHAAATLGHSLAGAAHGASATAGRAAATLAHTLAGSAHGASTSTGHAAGQLGHYWFAVAHGASASHGRAACTTTHVIDVRPQPVGAGSYAGWAWGHPEDRLIVTLAEGFDETPSLSTTDQQRAQGHGTWTGDDYFVGRSLTLTFAVLGANNDDLRELLALIELAWWPDSIDRPLRLFDGVRYLTARVRRRRFEHFRAGAASGTGLVVVEFYGADPFYHGDDVTVPLDATAPVVVRNPGVPVPVRFTLHGPATNPSLTLVESGAVLHFPVVLGGGDVLTIDGDMRSFRLNGAPQAIALASGARWWGLAKGTQHVTYTESHGGPGAAALTFTPSWT